MLGYLIFSCSIELILALFVCVQSYLTFAFFLLSQIGLNCSLSNAEAKSVCVIGLLSKLVLAGSSLAVAEFRAQEGAHCSSLGEERRPTQGAEFPFPLVLLFYLF